MAPAVAPLTDPVAEGTAGPRTVRCRLRLELLEELGMAGQVMEYPEIEVAGLTAADVVELARFSVAEELGIPVDDVEMEIAGFR